MNYVEWVDLGKLIKEGRAEWVVLEGPPQTVHFLKETYTADQVVSLLEQLGFQSTEWNLDKWVYAYIGLDKPPTPSVENETSPSSPPASPSGCST